MKAYSLHDALALGARVRALFLPGRELKRIPESVLSLSQLEEIDLRDNAIADWPEELSQLKALRVLDLSGNALRAWPKDSAMPPNLEVLRLNRNPGLQAGHWAPQCSSIKELQLMECGLEKSPDLSKLPGLSKLLLSGNALRKLPSRFAWPTEMTELDLSQNQIGSLPAALGALVKLERLSLSGNLLKRLPRKASAWASLRIIDLSGNRFTEVPAELKGTGLIQKLSLRKNRLTIAPSWLFDMPWLKELDLAENRIEAISVAGGGGSRLERLDLSKNSLPHLPLDFHKLNRLRKLWLHHNQLSVLPALPTSLRQLDLSNNLFVEFPEEIVSIHSLEALYLGYNPLSDLPADLEGMNSLNTLHLQKTRIRGVPDGLYSLPVLSECKGLLRAGDMKKWFRFRKKLVMLGSSLQAVKDVWTFWKAERLIWPEGWKPSDWLLVINAFPRTGKFRQALWARFSAPDPKQMKGAGLYVTSTGKGEALQKWIEFLRESDHNLTELNHPDVDVILIGKPPLAAWPGMDEYVPALLDAEQERPPAIEIRSSMDAGQQIKLSKLLHHPNPANRQLAYHMLRQNGCPPQMQADLLLRWLRGTSEAERKSCQKILEDEWGGVPDPAFWARASRLELSPDKEAVWANLLRGLPTDEKKLMSLIAEGY